jgi:hypothetical protein
LSSSPWWNSSESWELPHSLPKRREKVKSGKSYMRADLTCEW